MPMRVVTDLISDVQTDFDWELDHEAAMLAVSLLRTAVAAGDDQRLEAVARALEDAVTIEITGR
jgi:hypothetical protein